MSDEIRKTLLNLKILGSLDAKLAKVKGERKQLQDQLQEKKDALQLAEADLQDKSAVYNERKQMYGREERFLKDEQSKLVDRRKALQSLQSYKLQQAAEREIEAASKQLGKQEENLIAALDVVESLEAEAKAAQELFDGLKTEFEALEKEVEETINSLEERTVDEKQEREQTAGLVDSKTLALYERIAERNPMDAVVALKNNTCMGCFLGLGPQAMVEVGRAKEIIRCRGCGRILYLGDSEEE